MRNTEVADTTNLPCIKDIITRRQNSLFGRHVVRLDDHTPAHPHCQCHRSRQSELAVGAGEQVTHATRGFNKSPTGGTPFGIRAEWTL